MTTPDKNPEDLLRREIVADAERQAERIRRKAKQEAEKITDAAAKAVEEEREKTLAQARENAKRRAALITAKAPIEIARIRDSRIESILEDVRKKVLQKLSESEASSELMIRLISEAVKILRTDCVVHLSVRDMASLLSDPNWRNKIPTSFALELSEDPLPDGIAGPLLFATDKKTFCDNRLDRRLERMWPQMRPQVAQMLSLVSSTGHEGTCEPSTLNDREMAPEEPVVTKISGPIVMARAMSKAQMFEVVQVGDDGLIGEVVKLDGDRATIQIYEDTTLLRPGAAIRLTGKPLSVSLGPGLVGNIYDGIQRPLPAIQKRSGAWIGRGGSVDSVDTQKKWHFIPEASIKVGERISGGATLGTVRETELFTHTVMVPPDCDGELISIAPEGDYNVLEQIARVNTPRGEREIALLQQWPVRTPRPVKKRLRISTPLVTGQRIIDTLFPIGKGGAAAIPGGFGTGKTCTQHQLAKWSDADIIVYIGCGERGNEMTDVLREFPQIIDPGSGRPLMERTILIANTSNMPVAAREVSIYTGITIAEYYRDMGCSVAVFADSTSRWAEALRELAARLEEMPAEEGFPATLPSRLAQFYERAGHVMNLNSSEGAITIVGAVSPPGGDFSEPVTQHTQRFIRCFWALDPELANARHYPSINWLRSYSEYGEDVTDWWARRTPDWEELRTETMQILQREDRLQQIVKLVGPDVLPDSQRLILFVADLIKDGFLAQSAFDKIDMYCSPERQMVLLRMIITTYRKGLSAIESGAPLLKIQQLDTIPAVMRAKATYSNDQLDELTALENRLHGQLDELIAEYRK